LAWFLGEGMATARQWRQAGHFTRAVVLTICVVIVAGMTARSVWVLSRIADQIDNTGIYSGWRGVSGTWSELKEDATSWPWASWWPNRELPQAVLYLSNCTTPSDTVLLTWPAPEFNYFARRRFAAGHVEFLPPSAFTTVEDQRQMLGRLAHEAIPVILTNQDRHEEFARAYPAVASYLSSRYRPFAEFTLYDGSNIVVSSREDLRPTRTWGPENWPCAFQ